MSTPHDIVADLRMLAITANALRPHTLTFQTGYEPDRSDIRPFQDDLYTLAGMVDRVFENYGKHLEALGIVSAQDVKRHFTNVVVNAIEGNALFCIERGIEKRIEDRANV